MKLYEQLLSGRTGGPPAAASSKGSDRSLAFQDWVDLFGADGPFGGGFSPTTWGSIADEELTRSVAEAYTSNGPVFALCLARMQVFSQARFQWTRWAGGTATDLFGTDELAVLERPWRGGTTADLLARMEVHVTTAGNAFVRRIRSGVRGTASAVDRLTLMRPEWTVVIMGSNEDADHPADASDTEVLGYAFRPAGRPEMMRILLPEEVAHYAPIPDPTSHFVGMSWITPVLGEVLADDASEIHKRKFFQNAATPNLAIKFDPSVTVKQVKAFKRLIEEEHTGRFNAYKTLYLGGGADPQVIGKDFQQLAFAATQGKGESRLAAAAGTPPSYVGFSEGLQGSALNAGNYGAARRRFGDGTMAHLWNNAAASLEVILNRPTGAALTVDTRGIPFLREDAKDHADIQNQQADTITRLVKEGFTPESAIDAVKNNDWSRLKHTGYVSVQLQIPGAQNTPAAGSNAIGGAA